MKLIKLYWYYLQFKILNIFSKNLEFLKFNKILVKFWYKILEDEKKLSIIWKFYIK
jgi:hypothetical protein